MQEVKTAGKPTLPASLRTAVIALARGMGVTDLLWAEPAAARILSGYFPGELEVWGAAALELAAEMFDVDLTRPQSSLAQSTFQSELAARGVFQLAVHMACAVTHSEAELPQEAGSDGGKEATPAA